MNATALQRANEGEVTAVASQFLTFEVAGELFALPILSVQEIRSSDHITRIPQSPDFVLGITNLRGVMVPILDLRRCLSLGAQDATPTTAVIVVRMERASETTVVGLVVDAVSDVANFEAAGIRPPPPACGSVDRHFVAGLATLESRLVLLLDLDRLIESSTVHPNDTPDAPVGR